MTAITLNLNAVVELTKEEFYQLCQQNSDLRLERNAQGEIIIMPPTGGETGKRNSILLVQLWLWNEQTQLGEVFDSSTGFSLPKGGDRSPDISWVKKSKWEALTPQQKEKFVPLCPDFLIELISPSDNLKNTQDKMQEYLNNGNRLGWLINRQQKQVEIDRPEQVVETLQSPSNLSGEDVLPGFTLNLQRIWES
jgi:Uma2 family endonuclease